MSKIVSKFQHTSNGEVHTFIDFDLMGSDHIEGATRTVYRCRKCRKIIKEYTSCQTQNSNIK